jgi:hypothetical protein
MRRYIAAALLISVLLPLAGCSNYTQPIVSQEPLTPKKRNFETLWQAGLEMLRDYDFDADPLRGGMQDRRMGVIRSAPTVGKHWFEFWRKDAASGFDLAEGTLQTIYRQVTIRVTEASPNSTRYVAQVEVQTFRSDRAQRWEPHNSLTVYGMFQMPGQALGVHHILINESKDPANAMIVPLGRNRDLEAKMTAELVKLSAEMQVTERN